MRVVRVHVVTRLTDEVFSDQARQYGGPFAYLLCDIRSTESHTSTPLDRR